MKNLDEEIKKKLTEVNILLGKKALSNLTYDDLRIYHKLRPKKVNGKWTKKRFPFVIIDIPRIDRYVTDADTKKDKYQVGHRIVVPFTTHDFSNYKSEIEFLEDKSVMSKIMNKVREHGEEFFGLTDIKVPLKLPK
mgnify:CR=1 FL=1